jgi:hypothetical protein
MRSAWNDGAVTGLPLGNRCSWLPTAVCRLGVCDVEGLLDVPADASAEVGCTRTRTPNADNACGGNRHSPVASGFWRWVEVEQVPLPCVKSDEEPVDEIVAGALETHVPGRVGDSRQEPAVEGRELVIDRLGGEATKEHRKAYPPPQQLAVNEPGPRSGSGPPPPPPVYGRLRTS